MAILFLTVPVVIGGEAVVLVGEAAGTARYPLTLPLLATAVRVGSSNY
jgi:hypothetical protein